LSTGDFGIRYFRRELGRLFVQFRKIESTRQNANFNAIYNNGFRNDQALRKPDRRLRARGLRNTADVEALASRVDIADTCQVFVLDQNRIERQQNIRFLGAVQGLTYALRSALQSCP